MKIQDFINGKVTYEKLGFSFWINDPKGGLQMLALMRGRGVLIDMFKDRKGNVDMDAYRKFKDEVGDFIADAINEKLDRENKGLTCKLPTHAKGDGMGFKN